MITRDEIYRSLFAGWQLFLDKPGAEKLFDSSIDGFWRSFQAILLVAPMYAITVIAAYPGLADRVPTAETISASTYYWARAITIAIDWVTLPIILAALSGILGISQTYVRFIVARNWSTVLIVIPYALLATMEIAFGADMFLIVPLSLLVLAAVLRFVYLIARRALDATIGLAIGLVVLDFVLSLFINGAVNILFGMPAAA